MSNGKIFLYVGNWRAAASSWTAEKSSDCGFGVFKYNPQSGELTFLKSVAEQVSVGNTCLDEKRGILYCCNEIMTLPGYHMGGGGEIYAFAIDERSGDLKELNHQPSYGTLPSLVAVDASGQFLLVTHHTRRTPITKTVRNASGQYKIELEYDEASTVLFVLNADGSIGNPVDIHRHLGSSVLPLQSHSQIHSVMASPDGNLFVVCDKGGDEILFFRIDRTHNRLQVIPQGHYRATPGSSPRYAAFHPLLPYLYANHESKPLITAFKYDAEGTLRPIEVINVLPESLQSDPRPRQSDIKIHPSGKYLYSLIRGTNAVSVFRIDADSAKLQLIQHVTLDGVGPRGCAISPDGRFIVIAALESKEVLVWSIADDGKIAATGRNIAHSSPGNITFHVT